MKDFLPGVFIWNYITVVNESISRKKFRYIVSCQNVSCITHHIKSVVIENSYIKPHMIKVYRFAIIRHDNL